jgi:hypothetical protein
MVTGLGVGRTWTARHPPVSFHVIGTAPCRRPAGAPRVLATVATNPEAGTVRDVLQRWGTRSLPWHETGRVPPLARTGTVRDAMDDSLRLCGDLLEYALGLPEAWEDHPWGETVESHRPVAPRRLGDQLRQRLRRVDNADSAAGR